MSTPSTAAYEPRVVTYFPRTKDFERRENGDPIVESLSGPERIEARQTLARERMVAGAELKVLQEQLRWCYHKNGVNHYEDCKDLVDQIVVRLKAPYWGMKGAPSRQY
jgi:hypothetical protein